MTARITSGTNPVDGYVSLLRAIDQTADASSQAEATLLSSPLLANAGGAPEALDQEQPPHTAIPFGSLPKREISGSGKWIYQHTLVSDSFDLSRRAILVYGALARYMNFHSGETFPSIATLCNASGYKSPRSVQMALNELEEKFLVQRIIRGSDSKYHTSLYYLVEPKTALELYLSSLESEAVEFLAADQNDDPAHDGSGVVKEDSIDVEEEESFPDLEEDDSLDGDDQLDYQVLDRDNPSSEEKAVSDEDGHGGEEVFEGIGVDSFFTQTPRKKCGKISPLTIYLKKEKPTVAFIDPNPEATLRVQTEEANLQKNSQRAKPLPRKLVDDSLSEVFSVWLTLFAGKSPRISEGQHSTKARRAISRVLKAGYTVEQIKKAIEEYDISLKESKTAYQYTLKFENFLSRKYYIEFYQKHKLRKEKQKRIENEKPDVLAIRKKMAKIMGKSYEDELFNNAIEVEKYNGAIPVVKISYFFLNKIYLFLQEVIIGFAFEVEWQDETLKNYQKIFIGER